MRTLAGLVGLMVLAGCGGSAPARPAPTPDRGEALDNALREQLETLSVPGISAAVVFKDGSEWSGAAGDAVVDPEQPMTTNTSTLFDSVTKTATATLALKLEEAGKLRLDDPIKRYYPAWNGDPRATVRDLLGHTSGAPRDPGLRLLKRVLSHPRAALGPRQHLAAAGKPGPRTTDAEYSNTGFVIAGLVLERAAGEPLARAMRRYVLAGFDGLALQPGERPHPPRAHIYSHPNGGADPVDVSHAGPYIPSRAWAGIASSAGALSGDVPSLARWGHALFTGQIISAASLKEMTRWRAGASRRGYGLGLMRDDSSGIEMWGHIGDGLGAHTEFWYAPREGITVAVNWNDDFIDSEPTVMRALVRAALGR